MEGAIPSGYNRVGMEFVVGKGAVLFERLSHAFTLKT
jgi:hypothetical protein